VARIPTAPIIARTGKPPAADDSFFDFEKTFPLTRELTSRVDPHAVAAYSVAMCIAGRTPRLLEVFSNAYGTLRMGDAFATYVREFCPDLVRYRREAVWLRFVGYSAHDSIWYYALISGSSQEPLEGKPWVSVRRSADTGEAVLTGIFLPQDRQAAPPLPGGLAMHR
jgi:hypothetical protein